MDSYYQDHPGNEMSEGLRYNRLQNAWPWLRNDVYLPGEGHPQQDTSPSSDHWNDHPQGDTYVACNPCPTEFPSHHRKKEHNTFETTVIQRLDALQAKMDKMALANEEVGLRIRSSTQTDVMLMETNLRNRFEEQLSAHEASLVRRLEEYSSKTAHVYEKLLHKRFEDLQHELQSVTCWMIRLENRMEKEMGQLYCGMFKAQGRFDDNDDVSEGQNACSPFPEDELPGYIAESIPEDPRTEGVEKGCESTSPVSCAYNENERFLCDDIASSRGGLANEAVHRGSMGGWDFMACSPVEQRDHSNGTELPSHLEEPSSSPTNRACSSCELACAPQVQACFGALASSASRNKSHEESSWAEPEPSVDVEEQQRKGKKKRRGYAQVWIPRGTLEVMGIFHMTELSLGEKSCVPYQAKQGRKKSSTPPGGIG